MENERLVSAWSETGFEVVRGEYFSCVSQPCLSLSPDKMWVNSVCLKKLPSASYIHIMVNQGAKTLALSPCRQDAKDALRWCSHENGKRKPRQISCRFFSAMLYDRMGWNPSCQYKVLGTLSIGGNGEVLLFDLTSAYSGRSGKARFPLDWQDSFGLSAEEHRTRLRPCLFENLTVWEECPVFPHPAEGSNISLQGEGEDS